MKKIILAGTLGIAVLLSMNLPGTEAPKGRAATTNLEIQEVTKYYSMSTYEVSQKEIFNLNKAEELTAFV